MTIRKALRESTRCAAAVTFVALIAGCEKDGEDFTADDVEVETEGPLGEVLEAWDEADLTPVDFRPVHDEAEAVGVDLGDGECLTGRVDDIATVVCAYGSDEEAEAVEDAGLKLVGEATGASLASGSRVLIVADRDGADPDGKHINAITKTFRKLE